jgi:beta-mannosidase
MPRDFDSANWLGQILCGFSLEYSIEHLRRQMPRTMGALYWMLNDTWPCSSFSTVDYFGRWKAPHYYIKRAFAPVAVSGVEDLKRELVEIHAVNDLTRAVDSQLVWTVLNVAGRVLGRGRQKVRLASQSHAHLMDLNMQPFLARYAPNDLLVFFSLMSDGSQALSRNLAFFQPPRLMPLVDPRLMATVRAAAPGEFEITVRSRAPALHVWLDVDGLDARFSDNFFHLPPGQPIRISVVPQSPTSLETVRRRLKLRSLFDTYRSVR